MDITVDIKPASHLVGTGIVAVSTSPRNGNLLPAKQEGLTPALLAFVSPCHARRDNRSLPFWKKNKHQQDFIHISQRQGLWWFVLTKLKRLYNPHVTYVSHEMRSSRTKEHTCMKSNKTEQTSPLPTSTKLWHVNLDARRNIFPAFYLWLNDSEMRHFDSCQLALREEKVVLLFFFRQALINTKQKLILCKTCGIEWI